jgi:hypothetical protein
MRILIAVATGAVLMAAAEGHAACDAKAEAKHRFSSAEQPDIFIVESFGASCADARLLIYVRTVDHGWHPLVIAPFTEYLDASLGPAELPEALAEIAGRIEGPMMSRLETWSEIQRASTQPQGNPWRGTPLVRTEYERLYNSKPRYVFVPVAPPRAKLVVWDEQGRRPVDFVFYGD